jgi:hypothetical protein
MFVAVVIQNSVHCYVYSVTYLIALLNVTHSCIATSIADPDPAIHNYLYMKKISIFLPILQQNC